METIQQVLAEERKKSKLNIEALSQFLYGQKQYRQIKQVFATRPSIPIDFNDYNKSRKDLIKKSMKAFPSYYNNSPNKQPQNKNNVLFYSLSAPFQLPLTLHGTMFMKCVEIMGTDSQNQEWMQKIINCQIVGCYAQTEIGHGSDVRSLQTTATYVVDTDQFIINSPTISAAKYWPGDLGINSTHALVFANMIVHGKSHGIQSFIVPIRDTKTYETLPNIEVGDIGPKYGYHTKDNGFLLMKNIRIPKRNMLRKFISVSKSGDIKIKGDPKVSYATMMVIRQAISCVLPKCYAQGILIASRYSLFRKQFKDKNKQEIKIIEYQNQKEKIIPRIAEYYAVILAGNRIKQISDLNLKNVKQKSDFSLMNQTHVCLCLGKVLFSQICYDGMEICRKACGGHGFSLYSGLPLAIHDYASNLTYQGQNTVLCLQIARYLLKSYKNFAVKQKHLDESVRYIESLSYFQQKRVKIDEQNFMRWTMEDMRIVLAQSVIAIISDVTQKMLNKEEGVTDLEVSNHIAGIDLRRLAMAHATYYTFDCNMQAVLSNKNEVNREILIQLCLLFGATSISKAVGIAEHEFIEPTQISSLNRLKQVLMDKIRPQMAGLLDSFAIPQSAIRSALTQGDPYTNYLELARKCEINEGVSNSAMIIKNGIQGVLAKHRPKL